jgi:hypothetical protein
MFNLATGLRLRVDLQSSSCQVRGDAGVHFVGDIELEEAGKPTLIVEQH